MIEDICLKVRLKKDLRMERRAMKLATDVIKSLRREPVFWFPQAQPDMEWQQKPQIGLGGSKNRDVYFASIIKSSKTASFVKKTPVPEICGNHSAKTLLGVRRKNL